MLQRIVKLGKFIILLEHSLRHRPLAECLRLLKTVTSLTGECVSKSVIDD